MAVALVALLVAAGLAVYATAESRCQQQLNAAAADESAATTRLVDAIFTSDELEEQMGAYANYRAALTHINIRRAGLPCGR